MQQYIGFKLSGNEFTIPILKVREIINTATITQLPQSASYMKGVINLRGKIIPVVDLKELVNLRKEGDTEDGGKIIVVTNRQSHFGILVDSITSVINIDESSIEAPEGFMSDNIDRVEGVAKLDDRLLILLDTNKLVDMDEVEETAALAGKGKAAAGEPKPQPQIQAPAAPVQPKPQQAAPAPKPAPAPAPKPAPAPPSDVTVRQLHDAHEALTRQYGEDDSRSRYLADLAKVIDALATRDFREADRILTTLTQATENELYKQIGQVTRKLHNSLKEFKNAIDPRIRQIADEDVPKAVDSLEFVIKKTEEAANATMNVVEKYQSGLIEFSQQVENITSPEEFVAYLNRFRETLTEDLTEIMVAQEFQDITGQTIRRVIALVNNIESELVGLVATFGVKAEAAAEQPAVEIQTPVSEKMTQDDVESLLKEFGF